MGRKEKSQVSGGKPISFDFDVDGEIIAYEMTCPKCSGKNFVIAIDKSRIACSNPDCFAIVCVRLQTISDTQNVAWALGDSP